MDADETRLLRDLLAGSSRPLRYPRDSGPELCKLICQWSGQSEPAINHVQPLSMFA